MNPLVSIAKELISFSDGLGRGEVPAEDRVHLLIGRIWSLHASQLPDMQAECAKLSELDNRATVLTSDDAEALQNIFAKSLGKSVLPSLSETEKQEVCKKALPLIASVEENMDISFLLETLSSVDPAERPNWLQMAKNLMETIADSREQLALLELCAKVSPSCIALVLHFNMPSSSYEDRKKLLIFCANLQIPSIEARDKLIEQMKFVQKRDRMALLHALSYVPSTLYESVCLRAAFLSIDQQGEMPISPFEVIKQTLVMLPDDVEDVHQFLLKELDETRDGLRARYLSQGLKEHLEDFQINADSVLGQKIYEVFVVSDPANLKNPYAVYGKLKQWEKQAMPEVRPSTERIRSEYYHLDPVTIAEQKPVAIKRSELPSAVTREAFEGLWTSMETRLNRLGEAERAESLRYITEAINESFTAIKQDSLNNPYLQGLFQIPEDLDSPVHQDTAYLYAIIRYAMSLSDHLEPGRLLSEREEYLIRVFSSIQGCPAGRSGGIVSVYNCLPMTSRYPSHMGADLQSHREARAFLLGVLAHSVGNIAESSGPLMQAWSGERSPAQLSHYSMYIKNSIARFVGMEHVVEFDIYTGLLPDVLVNKSLQELLQIFYRHYKPRDLVQALQQQLRSLPLEEQKKVCESIQALCEELLPESIAGNEEEDPSELLYNVAYTDETLETVQGYSLTDKGAVSLLRATGLVEKDFSKEQRSIELLVSTLEYFTLGDKDQAFKLFQQMPPSLQNKVFEGVYTIAKQAGLIQDPVPANYGQLAFYGTEDMSIPDDIKKLALGWAVLSVCSEMLPASQESVDRILSLLPHNIQSLVNVGVQEDDAASRILELRSAMDTIGLLRFLQQDLNPEAMAQFIQEIALIPKTDMDRKAFSIVFPFIQKYSLDQKREVLRVFTGVPEEKILEMMRDLGRLLKRIKPEDFLSCIDVISRCSSERRLYFMEDANVALIRTAAEMQSLLHVPLWMQQDVCMICKMAGLSIAQSRALVSDTYSRIKMKQLSEGVPEELDDKVAEEEIQSLTDLAERIYKKKKYSDIASLFQLMQAIPAHERKQVADDLVLCFLDGEERFLGVLGSDWNDGILKKIVAANPLERLSIIQEIARVSEYMEMNRRVFSLSLSFTQEYSLEDREQVVKIFRYVPEEQFEQMAEGIEEILNRTQREEFLRCIDVISRYSPEGRFYFIEDANLARIGTAEEMRSLLHIPVWMRRGVSMICKMSGLSIAQSQRLASNTYSRIKTKQISEGIPAEEVDEVANKEFFSMADLAWSIHEKKQYSDVASLFQLMQAIPSHERKQVADDLTLCFLDEEEHNNFIIGRIVYGRQSEILPTIRTWAQVVRMQRVDKKEVVEAFRELQNDDSLWGYSLECLQVVIACVSHGMTKEASLQWIRHRWWRFPKEDFAVLSHQIPLICSSLDPMKRTLLLKACQNVPLDVLTSQSELLQNLPEDARKDALMWLSHAEFSSVKTQSALRTFLMAIHSRCSEDSVRQALFSLLPRNIQGRIYHHMHAIAHENGESASHLDGGSLERIKEAISRAISEL